MSQQGNKDLSTYIQMKLDELEFSRENPIDHGEQKQQNIRLAVEDLMGKYERAKEEERPYIKKRFLNLLALYRNLFDSIKLSFQDSKNEKLKREEMGKMIRLYHSIDDQLQKTKDELNQSMDQPRAELLTYYAATLYEIGHITARFVYQYPSAEYADDYRRVLKGLRDLLPT